MKFENVHVIILLSYNQAEFSLRAMCLAEAKSDFW